MRKWMPPSSGSAYLQVQGANSSGKEMKADTNEVEEDKKMENMKEINLENLNLKGLTLEELESTDGGSAPPQIVLERFAAAVLEGMRKAKARGWTFEEYLKYTYIGQTTDPALYPILRSHWETI